MKRWRKEEDLSALVGQKVVGVSVSPQVVIITTETGREFKLTFQPLTQQQETTT